MHNRYQTEFQDETALFYSLHQSQAIAHVCTVAGTTPTCLVLNYGFVGDNESVEVLNVWKSPYDYRRDCPPFATIRPVEDFDRVPADLVKTYALTPEDVEMLYTALADVTADASEALVMLGNGRLAREGEVAAYRAIRSRAERLSDYLRTAGGFGLSYRP